MDCGWYFGQPSVEMKMNDASSGHLTISPGRVTQQDKIQRINDHSYNQHIRKKAEARTIQNDQMLDRTEQSIKMCLFCLTLRYFQAFKSFQKQKSSLSGENDLIGGARNTSLSLEQWKMAREEANAKKRDELLKETNEKARKGAIRIQKRREYEASIKVSSYLCSLLCCHHFLC